MIPGIFLDRDGVIVENRENYLRSWADVVFYPAALSALAKLNTHPFKIVVITNQAGIGHGLITQESADRINKGILSEIVNSGGRIDRIYMCPHRPDENCYCRKPRPGMILQAAEELEIDLSGSVLIGDNLSDIQAGLEAGISKLALVRTGLGNQFIHEIHKLGVSGVEIYASLAEALISMGLIDA